MNTQKVDIQKIKMNPNNPRVIKDHNFKKLVKSIKDFPQMLEIRPIVVDENDIVLGGNMRLKACKEAGLTNIPIIKATELTEEQKKEFIVKDNVGYGEWDWDILKTEWDIKNLDDWGLVVPDFNLDINVDDYGTDFILRSGDKEPFQQMTFTFADEQAKQIKDSITDIRKTEEYKYIESFGNENSNGNALYLIVKQWAEQKIL